MNVAQTNSSEVYSSALSPQPLEVKQSIANHVRRWGGSASITLLDPSCSLFSIPSIKGIIGYRLESNCVVVFGDPLCEPENIPTLTKAFHHYCDEQGWSIVYATASRNFAQWAIHHTCHSLIEVGEELFLDPFCVPKSGLKVRLLRNKVSKARREGSTVNEYRGGDFKLEKAIEQVGEDWLKNRKGLQIYLAEVQLFSERIGKRWFYAKQHDRVVGVLLLHRIEARHGWLIQLSLTTPDAPIGTSEQLVTTVLETLREEGCHFLAFGIAQIEQLGEIAGLNKLAEWVARMVFKAAGRIFHLDRRKKYWSKFQPQTEPSYVLCNRSFGLRELKALMRALNVDV